MGGLVGCGAGRVGEMIDWEAVIAVGERGKGVWAQGGEDDQR